jgi:hypothetical protein
MVRLETPLGPVRLKQALLPDGRWRGKPEHADLLQLAAAHDLALDQVRAVVNRVLLDSGKPASSSWDDASDAASGVTRR